jgi:putative redox protein
MKTELTVRAVHQGGMRVLASDGDFHVTMDYPIGSDEVAAGPTPLTMLLASLAACSLNSVVVVLKKMQQPIAGIEVNARAIRKTEHPTGLSDISLEFVVQGDADPAAVWRALQLSEERLCPVWNMLKSSSSIRAVFRLENKTVASLIH